MFSFINYKNPTKSTIFITQFENMSVNNVLENTSVVIQVRHNASVIITDTTQTPNINNVSIPVIPIVDIPIDINVNSFQDIDSGFKSLNESIITTAITQFENVSGFIKTQPKYNTSVIIGNTATSVIIGNNDCNTQINGSINLGNTSITRLNVNNMSVNGKFNVIQPINMLYTTLPSLSTQIGYIPITTYITTYIDIATIVASVSLSIGVWYIQGHATSDINSSSYFYICISNTNEINYNAKNTTICNLSYNMDLSTSTIVSVTSTTPYYLLCGSGDSMTLTNVYMTACRIG